MSAPSAIPFRDPFAVKRHPRWHPDRLLYTLWARREERVARRRFAEFTDIEVRFVWV